MSRKPTIAYKIVFFDFFAFSSSPQAVIRIKNAQTAINKNPNDASIWRRFTIGANILIHISHQRELHTMSLVFLSISVLHTENAVCITNIPTDTHIIFPFHFLISSSPFDEKSSLITPIIRKITAMAIKKFLI